MNLGKETNELIYKNSDSNTLETEEDYRKTDSGIQFLLKRQKIIEEDIRSGFTGLKTQNCKLLESNENLSYQLERIEHVKEKTRRENVSKKSSCKSKAFTET